MKPPEGLSPEDLARIAFPLPPPLTAREVHEAEIQELWDDMAADAFMTEWCAARGVPYEPIYDRFRPR